MPRYLGRVEFRRRSRQAPWVIAGVIVDEAFWPARDGVEPLRQRLPEAGLVGWTDLPTPILAPDARTAAGIALDMARATWPRRVRGEVPYGSGTRDRG